MAQCFQKYQLVDRAIASQIPHGVSVEGTVVNMAFISPQPRKYFVQWMHKIISRIISRMRRQSVSSSEETLPIVKFCGIGRIDFVNLPSGDGKQLQTDATVHINGLDEIITQALNRRPLPRRNFNARARFYANGALTVTFLSLVE